MAEREGGEAHEQDVAPGRPLKKLGRRALLAGGAAVAALGGAGVLEYESLRGKLDHHRAPRATAKERYEASIAALRTGAGAGGDERRRSGVVHVGHSTHLVVWRGARILTDPWFYDPAFGALSHGVGPAVLPEDLGPLDAILISHDHADHADLRALDRMDKRAAVLVATKYLAERVRALGFAEVDVLAPWRERSVGSGERRVAVTAVPGLHDVYEIGFVIGRPSQNVYFAGDSRLHPALAEIAERFAPAVSILPVDGTRLHGDPLWVMTPEDAVTAARTLGSRLVMPSHADAVFSDPIASGLFATTVAGARGKFHDLVARDLRGVACAVPAPGELVVI
jgi:L-ascorbate metabolism protein UlaG (beta-lactamase superfamily)